MKKIFIGQVRPRLLVRFSNKHIYAQIVNDQKAQVLVSCTTCESDIKSTFIRSATSKSSEQVGKIIAQRALEKNIISVVFDRGNKIYHGRLKVLANAARSSGLNF
uniref:Large ribosomal subunit protein uL18c n=1 Tax=Cyanidium sp. THAL103 TaxID=3027999 RepID=A0A9Y1MXZ5_9RHOD|nr:ribosomal protein L18 [Cyanidium sp. THAL103]